MWEKIIKSKYLTVDTVFYEKRAKNRILNLNTTVHFLKAYSITDKSPQALQL